MEPLTQFTEDELTEMHVLINMARNLHMEKVEQFGRWNSVLQDLNVVGWVNRHNQSARTAEHLMQRIETILQERVRNNVYSELPQAPAALQPEVGQAAGQPVAAH